jgi:hypothetical protein
MRCNPPVYAAGLGGISPFNDHKFEGCVLDKRRCERPVKMRGYDGKFGKAVENIVALLLDLRMPTTGTRTRPVPLHCILSHTCLQALPESRVQTSLLRTGSLLLDSV